MYFSCYLSLATALMASLAASAAVQLHRRAPSIDLKLTVTGNTIIDAVLTNTAATPLGLLNYATFMDRAPVQKVLVFKDGQS